MTNKALPAVSEKTFCLSPWNQIHVTPIGVVKPCCIFDGGLKDENKKVIRINDDRVENIWNSSAFRELRLKMLSGVQVPECKKCYEEEKVSNSSDRIRSLKIDDRMMDTITHSLTEGYVPLLPHVLNLKIGNKCNLKCRMCQPLDSAMVDTDFSQISQTKPNFRSFDNANAFDYNYEDLPIEIAGNWINEPIAQENMLKLLANTVHLSLAGGEIAFTQEAIDVLKFCVDKDLAKNIEVAMSSNLTRMDDALIELMSRFKCFRVVASIDGVENAAEYIRYPSKWNIIKKNLVKLIGAPENVIPVIAPTIQIYNILNIVPVLDLIEELNCPKWAIGHNPPAHLTVLFDPQHLSIRHLPKNIKEAALAKLLEFKQRSKLLKTSQNYQDQFDLLIETLKQDDFVSDNGPSSKDYLAYFMQYTLDLDEQRGQRFQDYLPELYEMLKQENITPRYPNNNPQNYTYYRYRDTGFRLLGEGKAQAALEMFQRAYDMYTKDVDLLFSMSMALNQVNESDKALALCKDIEMIDPKHFHNLTELGNHYMNKNEHQKAIDYFTLAIRYAGENSKDYANEKIQFCKNEIKKGL